MHVASGCTALLATHNVVSRHGNSNIGRTKPFAAGDNSRRWNSRPSEGVAQRGLRSAKARQTARSLQYVVRASVQDFESSDTDLWNRMQLLARQLDVAINEEDYDTAARLRDESTQLVDTLDVQTKEVLESVTNLRAGSKSERLLAIQALTKLGDKRCLGALFEGLSDGDSEVSASSESAVWELFCQSGDPKVDTLFTDGMLAMRDEKQWGRARELFTEVIDMAPSFAEGYNKRATVNYMMKDFDAAIDDCTATVALQPSHFGALSGLGLCHVANGDIKDAVNAFRKAVQINPRLDQIQSYLKKLERMAEQEDKEE